MENSSPGRFFNGGLLDGNFLSFYEWLNLAKINGEVSHDDLSIGISQAMADKRFVIGRYLVLDLQETKTDFSSDDVQFLTTLLKEIRMNFTSPIISIVSDSLHFGLMRMLQSYAENVGFEIKIFKEEKEAVEWLPVFKPEANRQDRRLVLAVTP